MIYYFFLYACGNKYVNAVCSPLSPPRMYARSQTRVQICTRECPLRKNNDSGARCFNEKRYPRRASFVYRLFSNPPYAEKLSRIAHVPRQ